MFCDFSYLCIAAMMLQRTKTVSAALLVATVDHIALKMDDNNKKPWQVEKFEQLFRQKISIYFDVDDFEEIIEHYLFAGSYKEALKVANHACVLHPTSIPLMLKKAQLLASLNKEDHALELLTTVETLDPSNNDIFLTKGAIYSQLKNYKKAIEEYNKAVFGADDPDFVYCNIAIEYENLGNFDKTLEYLDKALAVNPNNDLAIYEAAYCFDLLSLTEEGISFFKRLIDRNPYSTEAWFNLGVSYINAGLYEMALDALDYSLAIDNQHEHSLFHKGYVLSLLDRHAEAIDAYKESMTEDDDDPMKIYYIGECYEKLEDYENARTWFLKSIHIDPGMTDAWVGLAVCGLEDGDPEQAVKYLEKGCSLEPDNIHIRCLLGSTYYGLGQHEHGKKNYEVALKADPDDEETWLEYAETLVNVQKLREAQQLMSRGMKQSGNPVSFLYFMAAILFLREKDQEAGFFLDEAYYQNAGGLHDMLDRFPQLNHTLPFTEALDKLLK